MAIRIVTDSSSDCVKQRLEAMGGIVVPMSLNYGDDEFLDGVDIDKREFYLRMLRDKEIPSTSQPVPRQFVEIFQEAKAAGDSVVAVLVSGALSGTFRSASLAREIVGYDQVYLVDSLTAAAGLRILVEAACQMAEEGIEAPAIARHLEEMRHRVRLFLVVDTLEYLYRGGRLKKTPEDRGMLANVKPVISLMPDGTVAIQAKGVGKKKACRTMLQMLQNYQIDTDYPAYFLYSAERENCMNFKSELETRMLMENCAEMVELGAAVGAHVGGGAFGIAFMEK